jgi:hypothetical protein
VDQAAVVITARCTAVHVVAESIHVEFQRLAELQGELGTDRLRLAEPALDHCGAALADLRVAVSYLLFLDAELHLLGGSQGVVPLATDVTEHVRGLIERRQPATRAAWLGAGLGSTSARVRRDAAVALSTFPGLEQLADSPLRARLLVAAASDRLLVVPETTAVFECLVRLQEPQAIDWAVSLYVGGERRPLDGFLRAGLQLMDAHEVAAKVAAQRVSGAAQALRQVELLQAVGGRLAVETLGGLERHDDPAVRRSALCALLRCGAALPAAVTDDEAKQLRATVARETPSYRYVFKHGATRKR